MKDFLQFINEDIDLFSGMENGGYGRDIVASDYHKRLLQRGYSNVNINWVRRPLERDYSMYHYKQTQATSNIHGKHVIIVVHDPTDRVAAEVSGKSIKMHTRPDPRNSGLKAANYELSRRGKTFMITAASADPDFTKSKIGFSLPQTLYRALSKAGYTIVSDEMQTVGGASIWKSLLGDPEIAKRMSVYDPNEESLRSAVGVPDEEIWSTTDPKVKYNKKIKPSIPLRAGSSGVGERRLVLHGMRGQR